MQAGIGLGEAADLQGLIAKAVAVGEVNEFLGIEIGRTGVIFLQGEGVLAGEGKEEGLAEHELGLQGEAALVLDRDVTEDGEFHGPFGNEAHKIRGAGLADIDGNGGILRAEFGEKEREKIGCEGGDDAEGDRSAPEFAAGRKLLAQVVLLGEESLGMLEKEPPGIGGDHAPSPARNELFAQLGFQIHDALADGGLADAALAGRSAHRPGGDDFLEIAELFEIHVRSSSTIMDSASYGLRKFADAEIFELDGGAFGFEAEVAVGRVAVGAAGDFLAVDPEADFSVDGADVVVVPLADAFGESLGGEAAGAVRGDGWEGFHFGGAGGEDIAVRGEPIGGGAFAFLPVRFVSEIEDLDFNAIRELAFPGNEIVDGSLAGPGKDAGVAGLSFVHPFTDHFEVLDGLFRTNDADGIAGAGDCVAVPGPGVFLAIDVYKVLSGEIAPTFSGAINEGLFEFGCGGVGSFVFGAARAGEKREAEHGSAQGQGSGEIFHDHDLAIRKRERILTKIYNNIDTYL